MITSVGSHYCQYLEKYIIILAMMKGEVGKTLREEQACFRQDRSCTEQIATLRIIIEQSIEWNSSLHVNFVEYEKTFDSLDRQTLWKILRHYGVPTKLVNMFKNSYQEISCRVIHDGQLTKIMKTETKGEINGIQWKILTQLDDLDVADDLALMCHSHWQMQDNTT